MSPRNRTDVSNSTPMSGRLQRAPHGLLPERKQTGVSLWGEGKALQ